MIINDEKREQLTFPGFKHCKGGNGLERMFVSASEKDTQALGELLGRRLFPGALVLLHGELGAGKTVFARGVARGLDVTAPIQSPTFTLMNAHNGRLPFYHFDLYRLEAEEELFELGIDELMDGDGVTLVEWAEKFPGYFHSPSLDVEITAEGAEARIIVMRAAMEPYNQLILDLPAGGNNGADSGN
jgi:tRNA threonylcarbamoyladenosine biosynthesis protein TsaE